MTKETMTGPVSGEVGRGYDKFMRVATLTVNGAATSYSYDNDGLLIGAGDITLTRDQQTGFLTGTALAAITDAYAYSIFSLPGRSKRDWKRSWDRNTMNAHVCWRVSSPVMRVTASFVLSYSILFLAV